MKRYAIFGAGRVGPNMARYVEHLGHRARVITKDDAINRKDACADIIKRSDIVAAAIPDGKLNAWHAEWRHSLGDRIAIHFSGAVSVNGAFGFHPLYSFPRSALNPAAMEDIAFACPRGGPMFADVFPGAANPHFEIAQGDRAHYHALAVLSGNLASYIWNEVARDIAAYSGMAPSRILQGYLRSIVDRFLETPTDSLTGPIARKDAVAVKANLKALEGEPKLSRLYEAFLEAAWPDYPANAE